MDSLIPESKLEERMVLRATEQRQPLGGAFELTPLCNLSCRMCYVRMSPDDCRKAGWLKPASEWLRIAQQLQEAGTLFLLLTGGEPFLYPGFRELYIALHRMGFVLTLNTNGTVIGPEDAAMLATYPPRRVNVTLYGTSAESYEKITGSAGVFEKTLSGIRCLTEAGISVKMNVSLVEVNSGELPEFYRLAKKLGIPLEVNTYMYPAMRGHGRSFDAKVRMSPEKAAEAALLEASLRLSPDIYSAQLLRMAEAYSRCDEKPDAPAQREAPPCRAARSSFWISWKLQLTPCVFTEAGSYDLSKIPFADAWSRLTADRDAVFMPSGCTVCRMRPFCLVCAAAAFHENGKDPAADVPPEYLCRMTREKLRLAARQAASLKQEVSE